MTELKTGWTEEDINEAIEHIEKAKEIIERYESFDKKRPNFVTSTSRLKGFIRNASQWATIIKHQDIGSI